VAASVQGAETSLEGRLEHEISRKGADGADESGSKLEAENR